MAEPGAAVTTERPPPSDLLGHPRGLWVLAGTELWERISFHGLQALLTLYMAGALLTSVGIGLAQPPGITPEMIGRQLPLEGSRPGVLIFARLQGKASVLICERPVRTA